VALALSDLLHESHVDLDLRTRTLTTALQKLITLLDADEKIRDPERFLEQVLQRERASPTYVENEVAFPHARTELVDRIVLAIGRSKSGIPLGPNGEKACLIFLIGVPKQMISDYLVCVGTLARLLKDSETRNRLLLAETAAEFVDALRHPASQSPFD
jgi:mannitol/fructose-specific phosphotransferase system IIA component (Ntr-type)